MDPVKEAFSKIKSDIDYLKHQINLLKLDLGSLNQQISQTPNPIPTHQQTDRQTQNNGLGAVYPQNLTSSSGNKGVPTDKQTNKQTNQHQEIPLKNQQSSEFKQAREILDSLDTLKEEIRVKFKALTPQEMVIFNTLYILEEDKKIPEITYKILSKELNLTESSIRDYINKLVNKGIPINKLRKNNKTILLNISDDLKKVATLATLLRLRGS